MVQDKLYAHTFLELSSNVTCLNVFVRGLIFSSGSFKFGMVRSIAGWAEAPDLPAAEVTVLAWSEKMPQESPEEARVSGRDPDDGSACTVNSGSACGANWELSTCRKYSFLRNPKVGPANLVSVRRKS